MLYILTIAAVEVCVGAGSAILRSHVDLGVKVLRHGGVALLTGGFLGVQRHFGTFDNNVVDFILFPPGVKNNTNSERDMFRLKKHSSKQRQRLLLQAEEHMTFTWWGQAHGPWFLSPVLGVYERVLAWAENQTK